MRVIYSVARLEPWERYVIVLRGLMLVTDYCNKQMEWIFCQITQNGLELQS